MDNLIPCKICMKNFNYVPGNARQICDKCRKIVDAEELKRLEEETITENNPYVKLDKYDPVEILVEGVMPELKSDGERFICAKQVGEFVKETGIAGLEDNIDELLGLFSEVHVLLFHQSAGRHILETIDGNDLVNYIKNIEE